MRALPGGNRRRRQRKHWQCRAVMTYIRELHHPMHAVLAAAAPAVQLVRVVAQRLSKVSHSLLKRQPMQRSRGRSKLSIDEGLRISCRDRRGRLR